MNAVFNQDQHTVGWLHGDVLHNASGEVCAFVRGNDVITFRTGRIGRYEKGLFRSVRGETVGFLGTAETPRQRRKRYQITPWLGFSVPAPNPAVAFRAWAIWDQALGTLCSD